MIPGVARLLFDSGVHEPERQSTESAITSMALNTAYDYQRRASDTRLLVGLPKTSLNSGLTKAITIRNERTAKRKEVALMRSEVGVKIAATIWESSTNGRIKPKHVCLQTGVTYYKIDLTMWQTQISQIRVSAVFTPLRSRKEALDDLLSRARILFSELYPQAVQLNWWVVVPQHHCGLIERSTSTYFRSNITLHAHTGCGNQYYHWKYWKNI